MIRTLLASAAAVALSAGAAQAQFLLVPDDNDHKQVVNQWAGATSHSSVFEQSAVSALRLPAEGLSAIVNQLTPGAPLGSDAFDHKAVAGENLHAF